MLTAKKIERVVATGAAHVLYREDGRWYHTLTRFPGVLFDKSGFVIFQTEQDYLTCKHLNRGKDLNIREGISMIPGYRIFTELELLLIRGLMV
jgi:5-methylcytosine-specific restriction protein A